MSSNWDYIRTILLIILVILIVTANFWAFTTGPCAAPAAEMPGWCFLLLR